HGSCGARGAAGVNLSWRFSFHNTVIKTRKGRQPRGAGGARSTSVVDPKAQQVVAAVAFRLVDGAVAGIAHVGFVREIVGVGVQGHRGPVEVKRQGVDGGEVEALLLAPVFARVLDGGDPLVPVLVVKAQGQVVFLVEERGVVHQVGGAGQVVLDTVDALELGIQYGDVGTHAEAIERRRQQLLGTADEVEFNPLHPAVVAVDGAGVLPLLSGRARQIDAAIDGGAVGVDHIVDGAVERAHRGEAGVGKIPLQGNV